MASGRRSRRHSRARDLGIPLEELDQHQEPARQAGACCEVTVSEHLTLDGTVVRTVWHRPYCGLEPARQAGIARE